MTSPKPLGLSASPTEARHVAISPHGPSQADPRHPATKEAAGQQAIVSPRRLGPIQCLQPGSAPRAYSPTGARPQLYQVAGPSRHTGSHTQRRSALTLSRPRYNPISNRPVNEGPNAPRLTLPLSGGRNALQGPTSKGACREEELLRHQEPGHSSTRRPQRSSGAHQQGRVSGGGAIAAPQTVVCSQAPQPRVGEKHLYQPLPSLPLEQKAAPGALEDRSANLAHGMPPHQEK
ncbi:hypothetical protein NDU88_003207 [Pleurodeles waltl]|uniref:Uncharacterized protein n=1 Tax=Pleurodeles waltl TaxID=8319 RepID=A0AAV7RFW8_PLEWA|nr:hypothetical protein NDU88_003207 [Pleurodeles waltl]